MTKFLQRSDPSWLVDLSLGIADYTMSDLLSISNLSNLRYLRLHTMKSKVQHSILPFHNLIREWSEAAQRTQAFRLLEAIAVDALYLDTSPWFISYLNHFPALELVCLRCPADNTFQAFEETSTSYGWTCHYRSVSVDGSLNVD